MKKRRKIIPRSKDGTSKYTDKQERKAEHIEKSYEKKGVSKKEAQSQDVKRPRQENGSLTNQTP
jgi:hypothetical protein